MSFIQFEKQPRGRGRKTDQWNVWSGGKDYDDRGAQVGDLGSVRWFSHWRRYVFFAEDGTLYDPGCLREIADFCEQQTSEQKANREGEKK